MIRWAVEGRGDLGQARLNEQGMGRSVCRCPALPHLHAAAAQAAPPHAPPPAHPPSLHSTRPPKPRPTLGAISVQTMPTSRGWRACSRPNWRRWRPAAFVPVSCWTRQPRRGTALTWRRPCGSGPAAARAALPPPKRAARLSGKQPQPFDLRMHPQPLCFSNPCCLLS